MGSRVGRGIFSAFYYYFFSFYGLIDIFFLRKVVEPLAPSGALTQGLSSMNK